MGHVVALDAQRSLGEAEQVLQFGERPAARVVVARPAQTVPDELLLGVACHGLVQRALVAALGHPHLDPAAPEVRQPLLVGLGVVGLHRHEDLLGHTERGLVAVELLEDPVDEPTRGEFLDLVEDEATSSHDSALAHEEHLDGGFEFVVVDPDHVEVLAALGDHLLLLDRLAHGEEAVAHPSGAFVLERRRRLTHLVLEPGDDLVGVPVEELAELADQRAVARLVDLPDTRRAALLDVEQQTRPTEALVLVELARAARTDREAAQEQVERLADRVGVCVRAEVAGALALASPHDHGPRVLLVEGHGEERVALVVAQPHVEPRSVLLDEAVLEHERLDLVADLDPLDRHRGRHHLGRARVQVARVLEVVGEALAQARGLADVDDAPVLVLELVRPRRLGDRAGGRALHHPPNSTAARCRPARPRPRSGR